MNHECLDAKIKDFARKYPDKNAIKSKNQSITYLDLEKKSNRIANFIYGKIKEVPHVIIILDRSAELIVSIIGLLKSGLVFVPLNPFFPRNRIRKMIEETRPEWVITAVEYYEKFRDIIKGNRRNLKTLLINGKGDGVDLHDNTFYLDPNIESDNLTFGRVFNKNCYIYFTSGSTGIPRGVLGRQKSLAHFIQWEINEFGVNKDFNISQLTPPSFDPFLRDIFLPLMTGSTCCIPTNRTLLDMRKLIRWIDDNEITLIHTVPSLLKALVPEIIDSNCFNNLKYILLAGELLRGRDINRFIEIFKDRIQLVNVYGPTETTLAKLFYRIKPADVNRAIIPVGKPIKGGQVLILDSKRKKCHLGKRGEIYIRTPFLSAGYYNDRQLNEKVFIKNPYGKHPQDIIYKTGDLGRLLPDGNIELSGRVDSQVKVRGIRIELGEIENLLLKHNNVKDAVVIANENESGDKYLCAYVVQGEEQDMSVLRQYLSKDLPDYMIPAFFVPLEKMPLTYNGKIDRRALPAPQINAKESEVTPRNQLEEKLVEIWKEVLPIEKIGKSIIGIDSNFFELGGHSLKVAALVSKIHNEFDIRVPLALVFYKPTIRGLARYINETTENKYISIEAAEEKEYYNVTSDQKRMFILNELNRVNTSYNISGVWKIEGQLDRRLFEDALKALLKRHESCRTSFAVIDNIPVQIINKVVDFRIKYINAEASDLQDEKENENIIKQFIQPFDLSKAPLLRFGLFKFSEERHMFIYDLHHIISDGISMYILIYDFIRLYSEELLPRLRIQYKDFSEWKNRELDSGEIKRQEEYWLDQFKGELPVLNIPTDYPRQMVQSFKGHRVSSRIDRTVTDKIKKAGLETETTLFMVLLAVFYIFLSKYTEQEDIIVGTPISGRNHSELENTVGMFVNTLCIRNQPEGDKSFKSFLKELKANVLKAYENQYYPFEELVNILGIPRDSGRNPLFDVLFVSENIDIDIPELKIKGLKFTPYQFERRIAHLDLVLYFIEANDEINLILEYSTALFKIETVRKMLNHYIEVLEQIAVNRESNLENIVLSHDFSIARSAVLQEEEADFNF